MWWSFGVRKIFIKMTTNTTVRTLCLFSVSRIAKEPLHLLRWPVLSPLTWGMQQTWPSVLHMPTGLDKPEFCEVTKQRLSVKLFCFSLTYHDSLYPLRKVSMFPLLSRGGNINGSTYTIYLKYQHSFVSTSLLRSSVHVIIIIISPVIRHDSQVEDVWPCWGLLMSFSGRCYRCEDKCNISAALHLSHLLFHLARKEQVSTCSCKLWPGWAWWRRTGESEGMLWILVHLCKWLRGLSELVPRLFSSFSLATQVQGTKQAWICTRALETSWRLG